MFLDTESFEQSLNSYLTQFSSFVSNLVLSQFVEFSLFKFFRSDLVQTELYCLLFCVLLYGHNANVATCYQIQRNSNTKSLSKTIKKYVTISYKIFVCNRELHYICNRELQTNLG